MLEGLVGKGTTFDKLLGNQGPIGKLGDAAMRVQYLGSTFGKLNSVLGQGAVPKLVGALAKLPAASINAFATALDTIQSPLTGAVASLGRLSESVTGLGTMVSQFTRLANPGLT
jgi:hypothetical protein